MSLNRFFILGAVGIISGCVTFPPQGLVKADLGGAVGYQHGLESSQFMIGKNKRNLREFGFIKVVGSKGTFAVDASNGAVIAIQDADSIEQQKTVAFTLEAYKHNQLVLDYFLNAGIPKEQISSVHATTSLFAGGGKGERAAIPKISGWQSVIQRVIEGVPVIDSVLWARMNDQGKVISELIFWPPISSKAIDEVKLLRAKLSKKPLREDFLSRLPRGLPPGNIVIRHSSLTAEGPFEVFASYDVIERRELLSSVDPTGKSEGRTAPAGWVVRHFDLEGNERKLPQEKARINFNTPKKDPGLRDEKSKASYRPRSE
jgi:hypothetical protein